MGIQANRYGTPQNKIHTETIRLEGISIIYKENNQGQFQTIQKDTSYRGSPAVTRRRNYNTNEAVYSDSSVTIITN